MDDGSKCVKYMIFFANLIFVLTGLALVALGGALLCKLHKDLDLVSDISPGTPWVILVFGLLVFSISFLGCCGAIQENCCMLIAFAIVLSVIVVLKVSTGAIVLTRPDLVKGFADRQLEHIFNDSSMNSTKQEIEKLLRCQEPANGSTASVSSRPESSNTSLTSSTTSHPPAPTEYGSQVEGLIRCQQKLEQYIDEGKQAVAYGAIAFAILEGMGVILVALLTCSIRSSREKYEI